ncbi:MAG: DUF58 domain-containing protein [Streptosporangiales bacterium]|nr:DUF58 domain-containing protein [Streptosporangiales bacterium]
MPPEQVTQPSIFAGGTEEILRRLELTVTRKLDGLLQGEYHGLVPGHGSEYGETRAYQLGDDVRHIDWNVTARMIEPFVRETIADRELETWLCVDVSASLDYGTAACEKDDLAVAAAGAVAFLTQRVGNRIGAVLGRPGGYTTIPARSGRVHVTGLLRTLMTHLDADEGQTRLAAAIRRTGMMARRRGLVVVISDFLDDSDWSTELRRLTTRHNVLVVEVIDPVEMAIPNVGVITVFDPETGNGREIDTGNARMRRRYAEAATQERERIGAAIRSAAADHLVLHTDRDWLHDLVQFVAQRRERIARMARRTH